MDNEQFKQFQVGSLVRARERDWVVMPSDDPDILNLRPLSGSESEGCGMHRLLEGQGVRSATILPPSPENAGD